MRSPRVLFAGRATLDVLYSLDQFPAQDTKVFAREMRVAPGGPALNAAITHALLRGQAVLMSAIGGGPWAPHVRGELERAGIHVIDLAGGTAYEMPLIAALINEAKGTRTIANPPQSKVVLPRLASWDPSWGELPNVVLTDGFHLQETLPLLAECQKAGAELCLDGGSWKPGTESLAGLLTVAICSERFAAQGPAMRGQSPDPEATIRWFADHHVPHIAVTRGPRSILAWDRGRRFEVEIEKTDVVDTLGAGDVLHGAFCYHFAQGREFEAALRLGAKIATHSCRGLGIRGCIDFAP